LTARRYPETLSVDLPRFDEVLQLLQTREGAKLEINSRHPDPVEHIPEFLGPAGGIGIIQVL